VTGQVALVGIVMAAGCVTVAPDHRCSGDEQCVLDGVQGRCEDSGACSFPDEDGCGSGGFRYHEHAGEHAGICVVTANAGIEVPAIDVGAVGEVEARATCAPEGAREAYVELVSPGPQTIYVDTGTSATTTGAALALFEGSCPPVGNQMACETAPCGPVPFGRAVIDVLPGSYCLGVAAVSGVVGLRVLPAGRFAVQVPPNSPMAQTTCNQGDAAVASCAMQPGPETPVLIATCPGTTTVNVTIDPDDGEGLDAVLSLRQLNPAAADVECVNASTGTGPEAIGMALQGPLPYYAVVDRAGGASCGHFAIAITAQ